MTALKYLESVSQRAGAAIHLTESGEDGWQNPDSILTAHHWRIKVLNIFFLFFFFTPQSPAELLKLTEQMKKHRTFHTHNTTGKVLLPWLIFFLRSLKRKLSQQPAFADGRQKDWGPAFLRSLVPRSPLLPARKSWLISLWALERLCTGAELTSQDVNWCWVSCSIDPLCWQCGKCHSCRHPKLGAWLGTWGFFRYLSIHTYTESNFKWISRWEVFLILFPAGNRVLQIWTSTNTLLKNHSTWFQFPCEKDSLENPCHSAPTGC